MASLLFTFSMKEWTGTLQDCAFVIVQSARGHFAGLRHSFIEKVKSGASVLYALIERMKSGASVLYSFIEKVQRGG